MNDGEWEVYPKVTALCIGNAQFFGGGMRITPNAHPSSGNFEVQYRVRRIYFRGVNMGGPEGFG